jgi:hypothetical protein
MVIENVQAAYDIANAQMPGWDQIFIYVNSPHNGHGGRYGEKIQITSRNYVSSAAEYYIHETGHWLGALADEYAQGTADVDRANVTNKRNRDHIPWKLWIDPSTPIPTEFNPENHMNRVIGLYSRGDYVTYKPALRCMMNDGAGPFCSVCRQELVQAFYAQVPMVESELPEQGSVHAYRSGGPLEFSVKLGDYLPNTIQTLWTVDGQVMALDQTSFSFYPNSSTPSSVVIEAAITDTTYMVRPKGEESLTQKTVWRLDFDNPASDFTGSSHILGNPYPNPVRSTTVIPITVVRNSALSVALYNIRGQLVRQVDFGVLDRDQYRYTMQMTDGNGMLLPSGLYIIRAMGAGSNQLKKIIFLR